MFRPLTLAAAMSLAVAQASPQHALPPPGESACHGGGAFDYVVVGGGTSGLVVASRLSEDPTVTVAVIEAGNSVRDNPVVQNISTFGLALLSPLDWAYTSAPQENGNGRTHVYFSGKALGGTSILNGMTYLRPQNIQIDAWEELGNPGLNWESLFPYFLRSETFTPPTPSQVANGATFDPALHGTTGPVSVGWGSIHFIDSAFRVFRDTFAALGLPLNTDANGGRLRGFTGWPFTLDSKADVREDAARAYLWSRGVADRPNLRLFVNTTANRLEWDDGGKRKGKVGEERARGVQVTTAVGEIACVCARREIVVSLGSLRTPPFLELSGVGNPAILSKFSIPVRVPLPCVGENLQDQPLFGLNATFKPGPPPFTGYPSTVAYATAADLFPASELPALRNATFSAIPALATLLASRSSNSTTPAIQSRLLSQQLSLIFDRALPLVETIPTPQGAWLLAPSWPLAPLSRGSVHLSSATLPPSANGSAPPAVIDPSFFLADFDVAVAVAAAKYWRRALRTPPLADLVDAEAPSGGVASPAEGASDAEWAGAIKRAYGPNNHPVGTAAMMARELGGVVDARHRVYGVANVRVVDASVLPTQVCGHLTSVLYALAERASEIIKGEGGVHGRR